jgi:hypothetical protein
MRNKLFAIVTIVATLVSPMLAVAEPGTLAKATMPQDGIVEGIQAEITSPVTPDKNEVAARQIETNLVKIAEQKKVEEDAAKAARDAEALKAQAAKVRQSTSITVVTNPGNSDAIEYGRMRNSQVFGEAHWPALYQLWTRESGWRDTALNRSSGACGIPQFISGCVLGDHVGQIDRGMVYIQNRYGNPTNAMAFWNTHHWY